MQKFTTNPPHLSGLNVYANERVYIVKQIIIIFSALFAKKNASIFSFHFKWGTSRIYIYIFGFFQSNIQCCDKTQILIASRNVNGIVDINDKSTRVVARAGVVLAAGNSHCKYYSI